MKKKPFRAYFRNCRSCNAPIAMILTKNGKVEPVDVSSLPENEQRDIRNHVGFFFDPTRHKSHFATCPDAAKFRKPRTQLDVVKEFK